MTNERAQTELASLKGCPFCGGEANLVHDERGHQYPTWYVICPPCDLIRDQAFGCATKEEAIAAWNTRTPSPETPVSGDAVETLLAQYREQAAMGWHQGELGKAKLEAAQAVIAAIGSPTPSSDVSSLIEADR
jgi:Lar family restriction alleviation protein